MSAKAEKCSVGDKFMQCVYQKIDSQVRKELFRLGKIYYFYRFALMDEIMMKSFGCFVFVRERKYIIIKC